MKIEKILLLINIFMLIGFFIFTKKIIKKLEINQSVIIEKLTNLNERFSEANTNFNNSLKIQNSQYEKTLEMSKTFNQILEAEKSKRIDNAQKDLELQNTIKEARKYFLKKDYFNSYKLSLVALELESDNLEIRFMKMYSLFNMNKTDSKNYNQIIEDCKILEKNGYKQKDVSAILDFIRLEKVNEK